jgi:ParB family transcriptional regulator, chromosome partitioning protein
MTDSSAAKRRRGLGRGLEALLTKNTSTTDEQIDLVAEARAGGIRLLPINDIIPNPHQPRAYFNASALAELAASIAEHGIIQPLIVTETPDQPDRYWLIAGERRWRAAREAGLEEVPVIVREATSQQLLEWALIENVQRADLNPLEEAAAYQSLIDDFGLTQAQVADRVGKSRSAVANAVRLLALPSPVQAALNDGKIHAGHARSLLALPDAASMGKALGIILDRELNVRQVEALVRQMLEPVDEANAPAEPQMSPQLQIHLRSLEERFRSKLGTKVSLERRNDGSGRMVVHFYSDDDLDNLYQQIIGAEDEA